MNNIPPTLPSPIGEVLYRSETTLVTRHVVPLTGQRVVLKQFLGAEAIQRQRHEAAILERLTAVDGVVKLARVPGPANVVTLRDAGSTTLLERLRTQNLGLAEVVALGQAVATILAGVHRNGVIHKDINPSNILVDGTSLVPTLIDFNISSSLADERPAFMKQGRIAGTLRYISPEQTGRTGRPVDTRSDLYALGVLLYEMAVGRSPFDSDNTLDLIHDQLARVPAAPARAQPLVPQVLSDLIMRLLEKEPVLRYQSAEGLAQDLALIGQAMAAGDATPFPLAQHDFARRLAPPTHLIGRDADVATLHRAVDDAMDGRVTTLLVGGAPGVGKSALINALRPMVAARNGWFVQGKFDQYQQDVPKGSVEALRALGRLLLAQPEDQLAIDRENIARNLGNNIGIGLAGLPEFVMLLGEHAPSPDSTANDSEARLRQANLDLLRSIASPQRPVVMVLDDVQWAPFMSLRRLDAIISASATDPIAGLLLVVAWRSDEITETHPFHPLIARWAQQAIAPVCVQLNNLGLLDVTTLVGSMLRLPPTQAGALATLLHERTEGNPYDTVQLVNALRDDSLLVRRDGEWHWREADIRHFVGDAGVVDILRRRTAKLTREGRELLAIMACLGGAVGPDVLALATELDSDNLFRRLAPLFDEGLLLMEHGDPSLLRFAHDRVQQAVYESLSPAGRDAQRLRLARRLATRSNMHMAAAEQYLPVAHLLSDERERENVVDLLHQAAVRSGALGSVAAERFLAAAIALHEAMQAPDDGLLFVLKSKRHAALYGLGMLVEGDAVYADVVALCPHPGELLEPAGVQIYSLNNRGRYGEAVALGLALLSDLGMKKPLDHLPAVQAGLQRLIAWNNSEGRLQEFERPDSQEPQGFTWAKLIVQTANAAYFHDPTVFSWLILEANRLWIDHGPCAALIPGASFVPFLLVGTPQDYDGAWRAGRHMIAVGEARGYESGTALARWIFGFAAGHWGEPIENVVTELRVAREALLRLGRFAPAGDTYMAVDLLLDCAATLETAAAEVEAGLAFAERMQNSEFRRRYLPRRQLIRALRGETQAPGGFSDEDFDEPAYEQALGEPDPRMVVYHTLRAVSAAIFGDQAELARHAAKAMPVLPRAPGYYITALARVMQGLALAQTARALPMEERAPLLEALDATCLCWLEARAQRMPLNFLHLLRWIEAERAWAGGDIWKAGAAFDLAIHEAAQRARPWHRALIVERAGLFHLGQGMEQSAHALLAQACGLYEAWGAAGKVRAMQLAHDLLRADNSLLPQRKSHPTTTASSEDIDLLAVLRASQALSSETSIARLTDRLTQVLGAMTGATGVHLLIQTATGHDWLVARSLDDSAHALSAEVAAGRGELPLLPFRYTERTRETLVLDDVRADERFRTDPYFSKIEHCSLLCAPVMSQGETRAILILENRQRRGAFNAESLDAIMLIAGQLSVSLDNALMYAALEERVRQRTVKLEQANAELARALDTLERAKDDLVRSEKLAALGSLVAGVAHELNTPIGVGITLASTLADKTAAFEQAIAGGLKRSILEQYVADANFATDILVRNLTRAGDLVRNFKQVAVDQTQSQRRQFELHEEVSALLPALDSTLRASGCDIVTDIAPGLRFDSYPNLLEDVLIKLIDNAIVHGYREQPGGTVELRAHALSESEIRIEAQDRGCGIEPENLKRVFEPFYTTRLGHGSSGLGLHIVHNIVTGILGGRIEVRSERGEKTVFTLRLPFVAPEIIAKP